MFGVWFGEFGGFGEFGRFGGFDEFNIYKILYKQGFLILTTATFLHHALLLKFDHFCLEKIHAQKKGLDMTSFPHPNLLLGPSSSAISLLVTNC